MASALIQAVRTNDGQQPTHRRLPEKASQTFLEGVPVQLNAGYLQEWDGTTLTGAIAGISKEGASNLTTSGVAKTLTYGSVPNQASAVKIPAGAPLNDGRCGVDVANQRTVFYGQVKSDQTVTQANVGIAYGMTKDTDNHWYVDLTKTTTNAVVEIVGLSASVRNGNTSSVFDSRGVNFIFLSTASQPLG